MSRASWVIKAILGWRYKSLNGTKHLYSKVQFCNFHNSKFNTRVQTKSETEVYISCNFRYRGCVGKICRSVKFTGADTVSRNLFCCLSGFWMKKVIAFFLGLFSIIHTNGWLSTFFASHGEISYENFKQPDCPYWYGFISILSFNLRASFPFIMISRLNIWSTISRVIVQ